MRPSEDVVIDAIRELLQNEDMRPSTMVRCIADLLEYAQCKARREMPIAQH